MVRAALRWIIRPPCFGGLVVAALFFALTMTPSLLPRAWNVQGLLAGLTAAIGYGLGSAGSAIARRLLPREASPTAKKRAWIGLAVGGPLVLIGSVWAGSSWNADVRELVEMAPETPWNRVGVLLVGLIATVVFVLIGRIFRGMGHLIVLLVNRWLPRRAAIALGGVAAAAFVVFVVVGGLAETIFQGIDSTAAVWDATVQTDVDQPTSPLRSGSPDSLIAWEDLGSKGREFTGRGPTAEEISEFTGQPAMEPIRVYGGMAAADSLDDLIALTMDELERTGAFERSAIFVQTPSGNGEVGRINLEAPEYLLGGDTAQVAVQYGYAGSFTTMVTKPGAGDDAARGIIEAVLARVDEQPADNRPKVYVAGESLGSLSTEAAFDDLDDMTDQVDGVLMIGPTLFNDIRNEILEDRDEGSPVWRPVLDDGAVVRFAQDPSDLAVPTGEWGSTRVVYLSNASDPVAWYDLNMTFQRPDYLDDPRGPDVSEDMVWIPVVTFWQTLMDLPFASKAPIGHGHRYLLNVVDGWAAVINPPDWTADDTQRLRAKLDI